MAVIKPVVIATSTTPVASGGAIGTVVTPATTRYFAAVAAGDIGATTITIPATSFVDDADAPVVTFPVLTASEYFNVYVNGVMQQNSLSTVTTTSLILNTVDISVGVPVTLQISSFADTVSNITTQPTVSTPVITVIT